jgi:hypothetical protein
VPVKGIRCQAPPRHDYSVKLLHETDEATRLAALYIREKAVPESHPVDAAHIVITTVNGLDFIGL